MRAKSAWVVTALLSFWLVGGAAFAAASEQGVSPGTNAGDGHALQVAPVAAGAVTLGEVKGGLAGCPTGSPFGATSGLEDPARPSYVAPFSGVLTSFSHYSNANGGSVQALVLRNGVDAMHKVVSAKSPDFPLTASALNTWPTRLPIKAGERIALGFSMTGMACYIGTSAADSSWFSNPFDADTTSDFPYTGIESTGGRPNVSAVLEPDVDGDLYGDLTQDLCPQSAKAQAACPPPDTTVTKKPKKKSGTRKVKITFSSTIAGSTFTCAIDKKAPKTCTSPFRKTFSYGKHKVRILATSPAGIAEATPETVKFKVTAPPG